jgi:sigma-B regulation protein RsbU (phosphoserine phosphatase)
LAIEHDWRLRRLIQANLEPFGLEVQLAVSGLHGLELLRVSRPDLILLDTELPDMEAAHLLDRLQSQLTDNVPVLVVSAEPLSSSLRQNGRPMRFLCKPFSAPDLLDQVQYALDDIAADVKETASEAQTALNVGGSLSTDHL